MKNRTQQEEIEIAEKLLIGYAFTLPRNGEFTFAKWIEYIEKVYSRLNPVNEVVMKWLEETPGKVVRVNGATKIIYP